MSLTSKYILSELGSPGKSGSFFYFSRDYKYIIKTIHHAEHKVLRRILREYYNHVRENPNTLLSQFYGLHRVKIPYGRKIHFVVMNNLFPPHRDIHQTFDLKGSTIGRDFKEEDLEKNPRATLKDLNWLRRNKHLELGPTKKQAFIDQMQKDVVLLQKLKIMDYSMLVGIHDLARGNEDKLRDKTLQVFGPEDEAEASSSAPVTTMALMRTPSKLETMRKAKELRHTLKHERPVPVGQTASKMPEEISEGEKKGFYFYSDDGGFRATHEDDTPGEQIYYLGIIDCLTHVSWSRPSISAIIYLYIAVRPYQTNGALPQRSGQRRVPDFCHSARTLWRSIHPFRQRCHQVPRAGGNRGSQRSISRPPIHEHRSLNKPRISSTLHGHTTFQTRQHIHLLGRRGSLPKDQNR
jgi:1-phosphatidylinositol-4-phosphate 5-kinase